MRIVLAFLAAQVLHGAVVQGIALDQETGSPLARTLIQLLPVEGTRAQVVSLRAAERGTFAIMNVVPGWYVLRGSRKAYVTGEVGQTRVGRPGRPFQVAGNDQSFFLELRMTRSGAVSGTVVDENNIGIPDWDVHVFSAKKPVVRIAQGKTDDKGYFRLWGLEAGSYFIRSSEGELEDGATLLPTWHKYGTALQYAEAVPVRIGETTPDVRVQPVKGRLYTIHGSASGCTRVTMVTDSTRRIVDGGTFQIERVAPGPVDLIAEGAGTGGVLHLNVDRDLYGQNVPCQYLQPLQTNLSRTGQAQDNGQLLLRRMDLDGPGEFRAAKRGDRVTPGSYEAFVAPGDSRQYTYSMTYDNRAAKPKADGSFAVEISPQPYIGASFRPAARMDGLVLSDGKPIIGAPVYVEMFDPDLPESDQRLRLFSLRTDVSGRFSVGSLSPAQYRVLSTFDFDPEDRFVMMRGTAVTLKGGDSDTRELKMLP